MKITEVHNLGFEVPEVATFRVDEIPATHQEWSREIAGLDLGDVIGAVAVAGTHLEPHPEESYSMARTPAIGKTRDWLAGDHMLHVDGTRWDVQPMLTVIGCQQADEGAPTTELVDTVKLLRLTREDGFWEEHGVSENELGSLSSIFADSTYYREALPYLREYMNEAEDEAVWEILKKDIDDENCVDVAELAAMKALKFPPKAFDLVRPTPFSRLPSLFLDGGGRNSKLVGPEGRDYTNMLHDLRFRYLTGETPQKLGLLTTVEWQPNLCLVFPQVGTLHRANPGNDHNRALHLGFLSQTA